MRRYHLLTAAVIPFLTTGGVSAQALPTTQPRYLTIYIEELKPGMSGEHAANEAGWPVAFQRAGSPTYYLALESMSGTPEVWFTVPFASYTAEAEDIKRNAADPVLSAEMARLSRADAQYLAGQRVIQAMARPDLSYGEFPNLALARYWDITTFRIRPGHEQGFEAAAKAYIALAKRAAPAMSFRTYMVLTGMPGPTFLVFGSVNDYAELDRVMAQGEAAMAAMTPQEQAIFQKFSTEAVLNTITNRFRLDAAMSYVAAETKAQDPAFWNRR